MNEILNPAFDALKTYDWGVDPKVLQPIDDAIVATRTDAVARKDLEARLIAALTSAGSRAAKDMVCRALKTIGTGSSVAALAPLLADDKLSHMARYALESIPAPEAGQALRAALPKVAGKLQIGIISSLGVRREPASIATLQSLLGHADAAVAQAAAHALGTIALPEADKALAAAKSNNPRTAAAIADGSLECAEKLLANGQKAAAKATYQRVLGSNPAKPVQVAATRGVQLCDSK